MYVTGTIQTATEAEARALVSLAIGRLLRMGSRPAEPGDVKRFAEIRSVVLDFAERFGIDTADNRPDHTKRR